MNRVAADGTVLGATFWFMLPANETPLETVPIEGLDATPGDRNG
jgi:two-component system sensor histidine kinase KdpD